MVKRNTRSFRKKQKSKKKINRKKIKQRTRKKYTKRRNAKRQIYRKVGGSSVAAWLRRRRPSAAAASYETTTQSQVQEWLFSETGFTEKYNSDELARKVCDILREEDIPEEKWISSLPLYFESEYLTMILDELLHQLGLRHLQPVEQSLRS